jgi:hypothetical protein
MAALAQQHYGKQLTGGMKRPASCLERAAAAPSSPEAQPDAAPAAPPAAAKTTTKKPASGKCGMKRPASCGMKRPASTERDAAWQRRLRAGISEQELEKWANGCAKCRYQDRGCTDSCHRYRGHDI